MEIQNTPNGYTAKALVLDVSSLVICLKCQKRYVEANDVYLRTTKKGQRHSDCKVCRRITSSSDLPVHLIVPEHLQSIAKAHQRNQVPQQGSSIDGVANAPSANASFTTATNINAPPTKAKSTETEWLATLDLEQESLL